jgi:hypothetical protein
VIAALAIGMTFAGPKQYQFAALISAISVLVIGGAIQHRRLVRLGTEGDFPRKLTAISLLALAMIALLGTSAVIRP